MNVWKAVWDVTFSSAALAWCGLYGLSCIFKECVDILTSKQACFCVYFVQCKPLSEGWTSQSWGIKIEYYRVYVHLKWVRINHETLVIEWTIEFNGLKHELIPFYLYYLFLMISFNKQALFKKTN